MTHPIDVILPRLHGVRRSGTGFVARCPGHDDRNPSLSVNQAEDGRLLLYCHAGCPPEAVVDALSLQMKDLFAESTLKSGSINGKRRREVAATYDYTDEDGELLFQVVRYNWSKDLTKPKDFRQRRPDGNGGWIYSLADTRRVPYRLPEVIGSPALILVEGEKDVEALERLGLTATTNAGGAGKFTDDYTPYFKGKSVALLPDNDPIGKKHARQVAQLLLPEARRVRIVDLPGLPPKGDVSDWLADKQQKPAKADLLAVIKQTPPLTPADVAAWADEQAVPERHSAGFSLTPLASLLAEEPETTPWLWENTLPRGGLGLLCAKPKVGKSTLARNLAWKVARGEAFLSRATEKGPVVYLALEEKRGEVQSHFNRLGGQEEEINVHIGPAPVEETLQALRAAVTESKAVLAIVDPLFRLVRVKDGNDYNPMTLALEPLMTIARDTGCHILVVHHLGKGEREGGDAILGSTAIFAAVDAALFMRKRENYRTIESTQRYGEDLPRTALTFDPELGVIDTAGTVDEIEHKRAEDAILEALSHQPGLTEGKLYEQLGLSKGLVGKVLREMLKAEKVIRDGGGRRNDPYLYFSPFSPEHIPEGRKGETQSRTQPIEKTELFLPGAVSLDSALSGGEFRGEITPQRGPDQGTEASNHREGCDCQTCAETLRI